MTNSLRLALLLVPLAAALWELPAQGSGAGVGAPAAGTPEAKTLAADATSVTSVLATLAEAIKTQLSDPQHQWINASLALVVGLLLVIDGDLVFKWVLTGGGFLLAMTIARNEVIAIWGLGHGGAISIWDGNIALVVGVEAGLLGAYGVARGIDGVMILVGTGLGAVVAHAVQKFLVGMGCPAFHTDRWLIVLLFTIIIFSCVYMMAARRRYMCLLAFLAPLLGGALVSSAISWFVAVFGTHMASSSDAWVEFLLTLCDNGHPGVRIFLGQGKPVVLPWETVSMDRMAGLSLWTVLFFAGAIRQYVVLRRFPRVSDSAAMKSLKEPILKSRV